MIAYIITYSPNHTIAAEGRTFDEVWVLSTEHVEVCFAFEDNGAHVFVEDNLSDDLLKILSAIIHVSARTLTDPNTTVTRIEGSF